MPFTETSQDTTTCNDSLKKTLAFQVEYQLKESQINESFPASASNTEMKQCPYPIQVTLEGHLSQGCYVELHGRLKLNRAWSHDMYSNIIKASTLR